MKIPLSLLKTYLSLDIPVETICQTLTLLGIEVDGVINEIPPFSDVIVAEILSTEPHPNAEKLTIAQVHDGKQSIQVVCGAPNCRPGIKTAFAVVGAKLRDADSKERIIEKASIRGTISHGMLCSSEELLLWKDSKGIIELPFEWENGKDLASLLWDPVLELSLTPNLGHCLSALGIARELGAALQKQIQYPAWKEVPKSPTNIKVNIQIENDSLVPRYMGRIIQNVKIAPSPFWLQKELLLAGLKPICNVVDVTNFIMLKTGHPMHAFDLDTIDGKTIRIGLSKTTENWKGLDGFEREIPKDILTISDQHKILALAGVLGSENSSVGEKTQNIFLEAAFFDPGIVRKGAKKIGLRTESAIRFEKGIDPNGLPMALNEATALIQQICKGSIIGDAIDLHTKPFLPKKITVRPGRVNTLLGTKLSQTEMEQIFRRLECKILTSNVDGILIEVPTYRFDLSEEIDMIEEVVRIYGYNNIEKGHARSTPSPIGNDPLYVFEKKLRKCCASLGLQEFLHADLIGPKLANLCIEWAGQRGIQWLKAIHAKTEEYSILRPSLLPGLLQSAHTNLNLKNNTFSAFEIGKIHFLQNKQSVEIPMLAMMLTGKEAPHHFDHKPLDVDFYTLKGLLENLFKSLRLLPNIHFQKSNHPSFHPGRQTDIHCGHDLIGSFGELHPKLLSEMDIKQRVLFAELNIEHLLKHLPPKAMFTPIPNLPASERDWTVSIPNHVKIEVIFQTIEMNRPQILEKVELIDLYQPENTTDKNVTFRFTYRDLLKTVSAEEVEKEHTRLISSIKTTC